MKIALQSRIRNKSFHKKGKQIELLDRYIRR